MKRFCCLIGVDRPNANHTVSVTSEEGVTVGRPGQRDAMDGHALVLGTKRRELGFKFINAHLGFQIPDLDGGGSGSAQPITDRGEDQGVDDVTSIQRGQVASFAQVPKHSHTVFATRSTQRSIRGNGNAVDITSVSHEVSAELAVVEVPDLDNFVPTSGDNERGVKVRGETDATDPFLVAILSDGEFADTQSVPQVDGVVTRSRDNLTVIGREGDGENILLVAHEAAGGVASVQVPQAKGAVPRTGQGELAIGRDGNILDEVAVAGEAFLHDTIFLFVSGQLPHNDRLITGSREDHVLNLHGSGNGGNPSSVASEFSFLHQMIDRHLN